MGLAYRARMDLRARVIVFAAATLGIGLPLSASASDVPTSFAFTNEASLVEHASAAARTAGASENACIPADKCCRVCSAGKACGNTCIQASKVCHKGRGCACNDAEICASAP
jgi:hypothetical protein